MLRTMADQEKKKRSQALSRFTRNINILAKLLDEDAPTEVVAPQFETVKTLWQSLEDSHDDFIEKSEDVEENDGGLGYLDEPGERHATILVRYSAYLKGKVQLERETENKKVEADRLLDEERRKREVRELKEAEDVKKKEELNAKFEALNLEVAAGVETFKRVTSGMKDSLKEASDKDKRDHWVKVESEFKSLKDKYMELASMGNFGDMDTVHKKFDEEVETLFLENQQWVLAQLKDSSVTSGGASSNSSSSFSTTKKESVKLPPFQGDEKTSPFLKFPIWKNRWEKLIGEYREDYRSTFLLDHLDEAAQSKVVGCETQYEEMMKRLTNYYGDRDKVVTCTLREVESPRAVAEGDYKSLLSYSVILETNYNRLKSMDMEHEISNTVSMKSILKKFPRTVAEKWNDELSTKGREEKERPFPVFIEWLISRKESWERMAASDSGKRETPLSGGKSALGNFGEVGKKLCFACKKEGHIRRNCPEEKAKKTTGYQKKTHPTVKKFWCAYHKGDPHDKRCYSDICPELRKVEPAERVKLLKENGDCKYCCKDHKSEECNRKDRICGGPKEDRGCTKTHQGHELYCLEAKVFAGKVKLMGERGEQVTATVVLMIMKVRSIRNDNPANVFWDTGCTSNFVREEYAKKCGFHGKQEELSVTTLGGVVTDITVIAYKCALRDVDGNVEYFEAFGMETLTGNLSQISPACIKKMFPNLSDKFIKKLLRGNRVDVLIGLSKASWHPERQEMARGGGDFWLYRGKFGHCVGGSHPAVEERTKKSDKLFHVNHKYKIAEDCSGQQESHELEFCPKRIGLYHCSLLRTQTEREALEDVITSERSIRKRDLLTVSALTNVIASDRCVAEGDLSTVSVSAEEVLTSVSARCVAEGDLSTVSVSADETLTSVSARCVPEGVLSTVSVEEALTTVSDRRVPEGDLSTSVSPTCVSEDRLPIVVPEVLNQVMSTVDQLVESSTHDAADVIGNESKTTITSSNLNAKAPSFVPVTQSPVNCFVTKVAPLNNAELFFEAERLGTVVEPRCGGCKCSKCLVPGSRYSLKEQQEYDRINNNLYRKEGINRWFTEYPWTCPRSTLPRNDKAALQSLYSLERSLSRDPKRAKDFIEQIDDMLQGGTAVILTEEEVHNWPGDYYYIPMVGVKGKKRFRVCFDASRKQCGGPSFNDCQGKGPDRFLNNILAVIIGFRNGRVGAVADIAKFHNQVYLSEADKHMQRFYWRNMDTDKPPQTFAVPVNNFGVKPANCIATCALYQSADAFAEKYPIESREMKEQTYVDDQLVADVDKDSMVQKTAHLDEILEHAGMPNKGWVYSGDSAPNVSIGDNSEESEEKVLGLTWVPSSDVFRFHVVLRFVEGSREIVVSTEIDFREALGSVKFTRRVLLANIARIFDPVGFLTPIILQSKLLMRETWGGKIAGWDDSLPEDQQKRWVEFLISLLQLQDIEFSRSLWPEEEVVGQPSLVIFSDGSAVAFGAVGYIRWELKNGGYWTTLIMAKGKIAPKGMISIPRMELNGSLMGNRIRNFLQKRDQFRVQ